LPPVRDSFTKILSNSVSRARVLPKTLTIQYFYDNYPEYININGNASGIIKNAYGEKNPPNHKITTSYIMKKIECPRNLNFVYNNIDEWLRDARLVCDTSNCSIMDLFYWE